MIVNDFNVILIWELRLLTCTKTRVQVIFSRCFISRQLQISPYKNLNLENLKKKNDKTLESRIRGLRVQESVLVSRASRSPELWIQLPLSLKISSLKQALKVHNQLLWERNVYINYKHKNSPFEMADNFDQKFGDFIVTNFHEEQKVMKYDQSQFFF